MVMVKIIIYSFIFITTSLIGLLKSKKYIYRVDELKEFKGALNIFKNKLKLMNYSKDSILNRLKL